MSSFENHLTPPDAVRPRISAAAISNKLELKTDSKVNLDDFELLSLIGKGTYGKVYQVKKKDTGRIYALKALNKESLIARHQVTHTKTERKVLQEIDHPFIVSLKYAFQTPKKVYMVMEFFNGGELFFHMKNERRFNEERAAFYGAQIVLALEYLHEKNIIYRDLKPENVLLDDQGFVKLTDFGLSIQLKTADELAKTICGTPEYVAPEVLKGKGYSKPVDWWTLGALLFELMTGLVRDFLS
jgi:serum/glucocorticoid-regulated kinase 2